MPRTQKSSRLYICYMEECLLLNAPQSSHLVFFFLRAAPRRFRALSGQFFAVSLDFRAVPHYAK